MRIYQKIGLALMLLLVSSCGTVPKPTTMPPPYKVCSKSESANCREDSATATGTVRGLYEDVLDNK